MISIIPLLLAAQPISDDRRVCARSHVLLLEYQSQAYGVVLRRGVDYPDGDIEYPDSIRIRGRIVEASRPYDEAIRRVALKASAEQCLMLKDRGIDAINRVIISVFYKR